MTTIKDGTIELHMKLRGVHYAIGLELNDFFSRDMLEGGMKCMTQAMFWTLTNLDWFKEDTKIKKESDHD